MAGWYVCHYRIKMDGIRAKHVLLGVFECAAVSPSAAILEAKFKGCAPMPNEEYLVASRTDPRAL